MEDVKVKRNDVISYMVDVLCLSREEAEANISNGSLEDTLSQSEIAEMKEFLGI